MNNPFSSGQLDQFFTNSDLGLNIPRDSAFNLPVDFDFNSPGYFEPSFEQGYEYNPAFGTERGIPSTFGGGQPQESGGNWLDRLGGFARDITPILYGAGSIIEGIRGVPRSQSRFAGFNQGNQYDVLARSLGYEDGREFIESARTGVKPSEKFTTGESVIEPSKPSYPLEDLTKFTGEGFGEDGKTLGLAALLRGANEYGISPQEFAVMAQQRGYSLGDKASQQLPSSSVRNSRDPLKTLTPPGGQ